MTNRSRLPCYHAAAPQQAQRLWARLTSAGQQVFAWLQHGSTRLLDWGRAAWVKGRTAAAAIKACWSRHALSLKVFGGMLGVLVLIGALWKILQWQVAAPQLSPKDRLELEDKARGTLAHIVGGLVILGSLSLTWRRVFIAQEGQITDRFTRAIDQLGSDKLELRLGGIYALERIARDSPRDHWPIMEVLTAYVREHARRKEEFPCTLEAQGLIAIGRTPGGKAEYLMLTSAGHKRASQIKGSCD